MQEDGSYVRIYSAEGELIGNVADDNSYAVQGAGALGQGKGSGQYDSRRYGYDISVSRPGKPQVGSGGWR